jgi:hypothetical protein
VVLAGSVMTAGLAPLGAVIAGTSLEHQRAIVKHIVERVDVRDGTSSISSPDGCAA